MLDGGEGAGMGDFGSAHRAGVECADWCGRVLCVVAVPPICAGGGDCLPVAELAGRQSGWDAGSRASAAEAAVWVLCGSRGGHVWVGCADVRAGMLWHAALADGDCDVGGVFTAVKRELSCDLH